MNEPTDSSVLFLQESRKRIQESVELIRHCVDQLDDDQVWWRPNEGMNSIANLLLHLTGNLRQRFQTDLGGGPDARDRPSEFTDREGLPKTELAGRFEEAAFVAMTLLDDATAGELVRTRRTTRVGDEIERSGLAIIFQALTHLAGHVQEVVFLTRLQLSDRYEFRKPDEAPTPRGGWGK